MEQTTLLIHGSRQPNARQVTRWPALAITVWVGLFVVVVGAAWLWPHVLHAEVVDEVAWIILAATLLRVVTILIAWAGVTGWGDRLPAAFVSAGLWGSASAQILYPGTEFVVKLLILVGMVPATGRGIGNMSATGWFNFAAAALVFGIPGVLFAIEGHHHRRRRQVAWFWSVSGALLGLLFLFTLGLIIGQ